MNDKKVEKFRPLFETGVVEIDIPNAEAFILVTSKYVDRGRRARRKSRNKKMLMRKMRHLICL